MTIQKISSDPAGRNAGVTSSEQRAAQAPATPAAQTPGRSDDRVELSEEARARADRTETSSGQLSPARIASLRAWLAAGGFRSDVIQEQVARRLIDLGEV